ncbi:MAG: winged helix-turn-helix domain-containing protein [Desulfotomaculum sp.]|nr:winged helix-turn-helix domain-containing protein [Desulfotomaculum sp.]
MGRRKKSLSKGLLNRVAFYIRDNSIDGQCTQDKETIAYALGLTEETVDRVIEQLKADGLVEEKKNENPLLPNSFIYIGEGAPNKHMVDVGKAGNMLIEAVEGSELDQSIKDLILDYDAKVREMLYNIQEQAKELQEYKDFKDSIVKIVDAPDGLVHVIAKRKP